jgi:hypothetical protein
LSRAASPADRVLQSLNDAVFLGSYDEELAKQEFQREFKAYWDRSKSKNSFTFFSLVSVSNDPEQVWYYFNWQKRQYVFAESREQLRQWLTNSGENPSDKQLIRSPMAILDESLMPKDFPQLGRDILKGPNANLLERYVHRGQSFPLLIRVKTPTGTVFAGIVFQTPPETDLRKGFRSIAQVPWSNIAAAIGARPVIRCPVERVDSSWIHGRDHDEDFELLKGKRVAVIGCGALGGAVARLLVQAGVLNLVLVDADEFMPANSSRHVLGQQASGVKKAQAVEQMIRRDFPHIADLNVYVKPVQSLLAVSELEHLARCDLIISAGIDLMGDVFIDDWRARQDSPPAHIAAWTEEFAMASHAVLLIGKHRLAHHFDGEGHPKFAVTDWPSGNTRQFEAGCGNAFQPHGAVDLNNAVTLTSRLALDFLLGARVASCRRVWLGERDRVMALGGKPRAEFSTSNIVQEHKID